MKLSVKLYRTTTIPTAELLAAADLPLDSEGSPEGLMRALREKFGPFPPRFEIFPPGDVACSKAVIGMQVMGFDILEANVPMAGLVMSDPCSTQDVDRVDGAIESELNRLGIATGFDGYEWRQAYKVKGN